MRGVNTFYGELKFWGFVKSRHCSASIVYLSLQELAEYFMLSCAINLLTPTVAIKHPVPDRVKPSFVIFDIRALWRSTVVVKWEHVRWDNNRWCGCVRVPYTDAGCCCWMLNYVCAAGTTTLVQISPWNRKWRTDIEGRPTSHDDR